MKQCPKCQRWLDNISMTCDCGYIFSGYRETQKPAEKSPEMSNETKAEITFGGLSGNARPEKRHGFLWYSILACLVLIVIGFCSLGYLSSRNCTYPSEAWFDPQDLNYGICCLSFLFMGSPSIYAFISTNGFERWEEFRGSVRILVGMSIVLLWFWAFCFLITVLLTWLYNTDVASCP